MTEKEKMSAGLIYDPCDPAIMREQAACQTAMRAYNLTGASETEKRTALLREMFSALGEGCYLEPPVYANWGGRHVSLGDYVYTNFHLTLVDDGFITIGDRTMIGPNVTIATAAHPIAPELRERGLQYNRDVHIGRNVWIGAGAIILPGVTVGDDAVIGAGSVVTRDVPADVVAVGVPCKVLRPITPEDRKTFAGGMPIDPALFS